METVHIETTQNVALHYEVATIVDRGIAVVLDWLLLIGYSVGVFLLLGQVGVQLSMGVRLIVFGIPWTFYHLASEVLMDGQSLGKRTRNIKVARLDGGQPGIGHYLLRWMLRIVDAFFMVGVVVILFNGKGQRLGDIAAGTTVISLKQRFSLEDTLLADIPEDHQVQFREAARITDAQARLIKEVLGNASAARQVAVLKLATYFQTHLALGDQADPELFLRTLLTDHLFLTGR